MSQEKQFCRNCGKRDHAFSQENTVRFWEPGLCSECHHLPIIGTHYDVFTGERIQPQITWQIDAPPDTSLSIETNAQDVVTRIEPTPTHDGKLEALGDSPYVAQVEFFDVHPPTALLLLSGGYGASVQSAVYFDPQQALSLLAWLQQEREKLEALAKEQS